MNGRSRVTLLTCGGTIASAVEPGVGASPSLDLGAAAREMPGIREIAELEARRMRLVASPHMTFRDLLDLAAEARRAIAAGSDGVVVAQGTDTIEEIAYGLDLLCAGASPVVVTGAMRNADMAGADGPANLLAAVRVAGAPQARGLGTLVVLGDEIHAARFVRKAHAQSPAAFVSHQAGPIGRLSEGDVRVLAVPSRRHHLDVADDTEAPPVCLVKMALGDDGRLLDLLPKAGFAGVVIEGFGGGHVTETVAAPGRIERLVEAMPVVLATRAGNGEVLRRTYGGFAGSETDLVARGVSPAGALDGAKARVLLTLLLMSGADRAGIASAFAEIGPLSA